MRLRIITATRGNSDHLTATVHSVKALDLSVRHILVCPAGERLKLKVEFPSCYIVDEASAGLYAALNSGMSTEGTDDFFTWINDDDVLIPEGFRHALMRLASDSALDVIYGRVGLIDARARRLGEIPVAHRPEDLPALLASGVMPLAQPGTVFRWRAVDKIGIFDSGYRLAGDLDFFVRAVHAGLRFGFHDAEVAWFRLHDGQLSKDATAAALEHARAIKALPRIPAGGARWRFRWDNRRVYWQRIRRHGFVSMSTLYRHG